MQSIEEDILQVLAPAASKAATYMLLTKENKTINIDTPKNSIDIRCSNISLNNDYVEC